MTIFPSFEFWLMNSSPLSCSLNNSIVGVSFTSGSTILKVPFDSKLVVEDFESVASRYLDSVQNVVKGSGGKKL